MQSNTALIALGLALFLNLAPDRVAAAPDPGGALHTLATMPLNVTGDVVGGAGLIGASLVALGGDAVGLVDDNRFSEPILRGFASNTIHRLAMGVSWLSTGLLEGLRGEDIERLPEDPATYLESAAGVTRFDTLTVGVRAIALGVYDVIVAVPLSLTQLVGASDTAEQLRERQIDARVDALGPDPEGK